MAALPLTKYLSGRIADDIKGYTSGDLRLFNAADWREFANIYTKYAMLNSRIFGEMVAAEIGVRYEPSKKLDRSLGAQGKVISRNMFRNIEFSITEQVKQALQKEAEALAEEASARIVATADTLLEGGVKRSSSVLVASTVSQVRNQVFQENTERIRSYLFSAVLDGNQCPICEGLDGMNLSYEDYQKAKSQWSLPIHHHCRCQWVEILKEEIDPPRMNKLRRTSGGVSRPPFAEYMEKNGYDYSSVIL